MHALGISGAPATSEFPTHQDLVRGLELKLRDLTPMQQARALYNVTQQALKEADLPRLRAIKAYRSKVEAAGRPTPRKS